MEHLPISNYGGQDNPAGLVAFLKDCQKRAVEVGKPQLVNISLDVFHIDPLAVLEAVYEQTSQHFFLENPGLDESIAAIEQVMQKTAEGPGRFKAIKDWATSLLDQVIFTGNTDSPYCGIHFFCAFNFFDEGQEVSGFPPAQAFVPLWQVSKKDQYSLAIANCIVDSNTPVVMIAKRILGAHQRFASFPYQTLETDTKPAKVELKLKAEVGGSDSFELSVVKATEAIKEGEFEKIVLARALDFQSEEELNPLRFLERLRNRFQSCYTFSYSAGEEGTFLGSTPELLIRVKDVDLELRPSPVREVEEILRVSTPPWGPNYLETIRIVENISRWLLPLRIGCKVLDLSLKYPAVRVYSNCPMFNICLLQSRHLYQRSYIFLM